MKPSDQKLDASMQAFTRRWMKSLDRPRASTTLGYFFVGLFIVLWSSSLTNVTGIELKSTWGSLVFLGFALILSLSTVLVVRLMAALGIDRPTRSAFLLSAVIGPYVNMLANRAWEIAVVGHVMGFFAAILAYLLSLSLDRLLAKAPQKHGEK